MDTAELPTTPAHPTPGASMFRRALVALCARRLDARLARGADPTSSSTLALRTRQLTSRKTRDQLAASIEAAIDACERPRPTMRVRHSRTSIAAARAGLQGIAEILRSPMVVYVRGIAISRVLMFGDESPLNHPAHSGSAWFWTQLAAQALEGHL